MEKDLEINMVVLELSKMKPYKNNIKKHSQEQIDLLAKNIQDIGYTQPIVVDKDNEIIAGHGRYEALKKLGVTKVPVVKLDISGAEAKKQRIFDNKVNESPYDFKNLKIELNDLNKGGFDCADLGFTEIELHNFTLDAGILDEAEKKVDVQQQEQKKKIIFLCDNEQYGFLKDTFIMENGELNTELLIGLVTGDNLE